MTLEQTVVALTWYKSIKVLTPAPRKVQVHIHDKPLVVYTRNAPTARRAPNVTAHRVKPGAPARHREWISILKCSTTLSFPLPFSHEAPYSYSATQTDRSHVRLRVAKQKIPASYVSPFALQEPGSKIGLQVLSYRESQSITNGDDGIRLAAHIFNQGHSFHIIKNMFSDCAILFAQYSAHVKCSDVTQKTFLFF